jgi:hypothetical protein
MTKPQICRVVARQELEADHRILVQLFGLFVLTALSLGAGAWLAAQAPMLQSR